MKRFNLYPIMLRFLPLAGGKGRGSLFLILFGLPMMLAAQLRFGYISYGDVCRQMPQYKQAQQQLADLKGKYDQEAVRGEEEFQRKFSDFLQGQKDFPANILQKRQAELQDVMERGISFRQEAQKLLSKAEQTMLQDVYQQLNAAIHAVAIQYGYAFVLNTDDNSAPFINPSMGDNITDLVRVRLGIIKEEEMTLPVPALPNVKAKAEEDADEPADGTKAEEETDDEKPADENPTEQETAETAEKAEQDIPVEIEEVKVEVVPVE